MQIAINGRTGDSEILKYFTQVTSLLKKHGIHILVSKNFGSYLTDISDNALEGTKVYEGRDDLRSTKFMISMGGDGTLLETVTHIGSLMTPILGINTGRLGFLASIPKENIEDAIDMLLSSQYSIENRSLLHMESESEIFGDQRFALNEIAITKKDTSSMIVVHTYIDGEYLNSYWSDGLIVATPTGSTGYSLSCGGPVVMPESKNFIITPISPHNLNVRPLVVSDNSVISFEIEGRAKNFLVSLDSRSFTVDDSIEMAVRRESFHCNLIKLEGINFLNTLRQKLNWGLDLRN
ncbi:NAD kinase [Mangrovivirga sp. M17]|uniref:NAD kinase n=1 Tax=Mangrovivirga halotolerans TaxID=2993936 RepID=A0ABT3RRX7_9BACT|nr:NAD kinase [Mangrovivirga halotolerans]MCX2744544.1 NAD kinase [Mangrovivirga halotolerans]